MEIVMVVFGAFLSLIIISLHKHLKKSVSSEQNLFKQRKNVIGINHFQICNIILSMKRVGWKPSQSILSRDQQELHSKQSDRRSKKSVNMARCFSSRVKSPVTVYTQSKWHDISSNVERVEGSNVREQEESLSWFTAQTRWPLAWPLCFGA